MCGISGFSWEDKKLIKAMVDIQSHRGPDQDGIFIDKNVSLGHNRLSIIDLSVKAKQPMTNEDNSIWLVYNGEIYNFKGIREVLEAKGHKFNSDTDSEVIIHAYEEYGEKCLTMFNGMFAFCIYDSIKKIFFLARDRSGIKPLYYSTKGGEFIFASELKAILLDYRISKDINKTALHNYLTFRYMPGTNSIFKDIKKLSPGEYTIYDFKSKKLTLKKYWELEIIPVKEKEKYYSKKIDEELTEAIKKRLISDVPLGAFLSGGLDSTYLVGLMSKINSEPIKTFSIGFESGQGYDESSFSRFAAETYNTDHHEIFVAKDSFKLLPKILWHMDEPIADFASIPTYILSEFVKKKVSVVLTGEGADELFGGYRKYKYLKSVHPYHKLTPYVIKKILASGLSPFFKSMIMKRMLQFGSAKNIEDFYLQLISFFTEQEKKKLCQKNVIVNNRQDISEIEKYFGKNNLATSLMKLDFKTWLPEDLLMKVDKTTMAHALEARVPFLDPNMIDLASKIPSNLKLRLNKEKYILRKAMKSTVPSKIYKRKKHGFNVPVHKWLEKDLKDVSQNLLSKESINKRGLFEHSYIEKLFNNYNKSKIYYSRQLWTLLNFEIWARIYLDRDDIRSKKLSFNDIN